MKTIFVAIKMFLIMTILTGIIYPLTIFGIGQIFFHNKANGSLITSGGKIIGSVLIGQAYDSLRYFWSRPSVIDYNPLPSGGSNYGPTSEKLKTEVEFRKLAFAKGNGLNKNTIIPSEMLLASGSGLDPDISPEAAELQVDRIVIFRHFNNMQKIELENAIQTLTEKPQFKLFGERRINVFQLNLELDKIK